MNDETNNLIKDSDEDTPSSNKELAHEVNLQLLKLILYRQERKFYLSAGLLFVMVGSVAGLLLMSFSTSKIDESVQDLLLILLTATATTQAKLTDFWFNNSSDDAQLVQEATSYAMGNGANGSNGANRASRNKDEVNGI
tara:strand:+ start:1242 stop:1658 length:417 start_codon:yes stop_codon:yes gene_type:complete